MVSYRHASAVTVVGLPTLLSSSRKQTHQAELQASSVSSSCVTPHRSAASVLLLIRPAAGLWQQDTDLQRFALLQRRTQDRLRFLRPVFTALEAGPCQVLFVIEAHRSLSRLGFVFVPQLRDVDQTLLTGQHLHKDPEGLHPFDGHTPAPQMTMDICAF